MAKDYVVIKGQANIIRNETAEGGNTAAEVGGAIYDVADKLEEVDGTLTSAIGTKLPISSVVDNLTSTHTAAPLSANQGKVLNDNKADKTTQVVAGNGLTGGGSLSGNVTVNVGNTDDSIVVGADGIKVDTQNSLTSTSTTKPLSAAQGKALQDNKAEKTRTITAGNGLTGGGDLSADRTINIANADDSLVVAADSVKVNTNNTLTSTSTTQPLSANQGKVLNEKVAQVETDLNEFDIKIFSIGSSELTSCGGLIRVINGVQTWAQHDAYYGASIKIPKGVKEITIKSNIRNEFRYAFTKNTYIDGVPVSFASGFSAPVTVSNVFTQILNVPEDAVYFYIYMQGGAINYRPDIVSFESIEYNLDKLVLDSEKQVSLLQKISQLTGILPIYQDFDIGNITLVNGTLTYTEYKRFIRTKHGIMYNLNAGDVIGLNDYSAAKFYIFKQKTNGDIIDDKSWKTSDYIVSEPSSYAIVVSYITEQVLPSIDALYDLIKVQTSRENNVLRSDLTALESIMYDESISSYNKDAIQAIEASKIKMFNYGSSPNNALLSFLITTDVHADWTAFNRALEFASNEPLIDAFMCLGDLYDAPSQINDYDYTSNILACNKPCFIVGGNHEYAYSESHVPLTDSQIINEWYNPALINKNGDIHPSGKLYWHRDISKTIKIGETPLGSYPAYSNVTKKIRIIGLDQYEYSSVHGRKVNNITQEQIDWLINLLDNTDSDTYVIILSHGSFGKKSAWMNRVECNWSANNYDLYDALADYVGSDQSGLLTRDFIPSIVDAWVKGENISKTTNKTTEGITNETISINHTFTPHLGQFICFINGHGHRDTIATYKNYPSIKNVCLCCTTSDLKQQNADLPRGNSGKIKDAVTVLTYDWYIDKIKLVRLGSDITFDMKERKYYLF